MNVVSFSLYGENPLYINGAIENARIIAEKMPGWKGVFYVASEIPDPVVKELLDLGAIIRVQQDSWHPNGMFWRFMSMQDKDFDRVLIRDVDSRISNRDLCLIQEWCESEMLGHIVRDHPLHNSLIMGGLWGGRTKFLCNSEVWSSTKFFGTEKGEDQEFLNQYIYPILVKQSLIHDAFHRLEKFSKQIKIQRVEGEFLGEVIDENGRFDEVSRNLVVYFESSPKKMCAIKFLGVLTSNRYNLYLVYLKSRAFFQRLGKLNIKSWQRAKS